MQLGTSEFERALKAVSEGSQSLDSLLTAVRPCYGTVHETVLHIVGGNRRSIPFRESGLHTRKDGRDFVSRENREHLTCPARSYRDLRTRIGNLGSGLGSVPALVEIEKGVTSC